MWRRRGLRRSAATGGRRRRQAGRAARRPPTLRQQPLRLDAMHAVKSLCWEVHRRGKTWTA